MISPFGCRATARHVEPRGLEPPDTWLAKPVLCQLSYGPWLVVNSSTTKVVLQTADPTRHGSREAFRSLGPGGSRGPRGVRGSLARVSQAGAPWVALTARSSGRARVTPAHRRARMPSAYDTTIALTLAIVYEISLSDQRFPTPATSLRKRRSPC